MNIEATDIVRRIDRGATADLVRLADTPEHAFDLLHAHVLLFFEQLSVMAGHATPGYQRLLLTMEIFWEGHFRRRALRAHCIPMLRGHPLSERLRQSGEYPLLDCIRSELQACAMEAPADTAGELVRRMRDVAREELARDLRLPTLRQIQYDWLARLCQPASGAGDPPAESAPRA
jgi:hypothetical protein